MRAEVPHVVDVVRFSAGASRVPRAWPRASTPRGTRACCGGEPVGVVAQITPWNYPLMMATWKWAPAVAAGQHRGAEVGRDDAGDAADAGRAGCRGAAAGRAQRRLRRPRHGRLMVEHPVPAMVALTGSVRAGREVMAGRAPTVKRLHLELGGKAPVLVFDDADLDDGAGLLDIGYYNAGSPAPPHQVLRARVHDELVAAAAARAMAGPRVVLGA
jgi:betaine-aldehyde dehydrogenase